MTIERSAGLGFGGGKVVALRAPINATRNHQPHVLDDFSIELDDRYDTATICLHEVDVVSGTIPITRKSVPIPLGMLSDLVRSRPMTATEREEFARSDEEEDEEFGDGEEDEGQRV